MIVSWVTIKDGSEAKVYAVEEAQQISLYHFYTCRCVIFFYFLNKKQKKFINL